MKLLTTTKNNLKQQVNGLCLPFVTLTFFFSMSSIKIYNKKFFLSRNKSCSCAYWVNCMLSSMFFFLMYCKHVRQQWQTFIHQHILCCTRMFWKFQWVLQGSFSPARLPLPCTASPLPQSRPRWLVTGGGRVTQHDWQPTRPVGTRRYTVARRIPDGSGNWISRMLRNGIKAAQRPSPCLSSRLARLLCTLEATFRHFSPEPSIQWGPR